MNTQNLLLILLVVAVVFGLGVVVLNRRSSGGAGVKPVTSKPVTSTPVIEKVEIAVVETPVVETADAEGLRPGLPPPISGAGGARWPDM